MKNIKIILFLLLLILTVQPPQLQAQISNFFAQIKYGLPYHCDFNSKNYFLDLNYYNGKLKPERTEAPGVPADAYFPVLIVFVQFQNDIGPQSDEWLIGQPPSYFNKMISSTKKYPFGGNWWDTYSSVNEVLSDYWMEQSRGKFHVIGKAYSVILDYEYSYYVNNGGDARVNDDIYTKLKSYGIDWQEYDRWSYNADDTLNRFVYEKDGYIDMIYKIFRSRVPKIGMPSGGIAYLGNSLTQGYNYLIDPVHNIVINGSYGPLGSGVYLTPGFSGDENENSYAANPPMNHWGTISFSEHEFGHYLFGGGHGCYGKMSGDGAPYGFEESLSPFESIFLGYQKPVVVDYNIPDYNVRDFSARNSNEFGEILQVPVNGADEFFLISNRRKISGYDRIMWGDTARGDPYRDINPEYGKGVYIYHVYNGYHFPSFVDQECADGLFNWSFMGYRIPDWSSEQLVEYFERTDVSYLNDFTSGSYKGTDGKSIFTWFSLGKKHEYLHTDGTDKIFTNKSEVWTSREWLGDRWDGWNVGYNEIFSPYSSPSTTNWSAAKSGVFIYHDELNPDGSASFKIFKTGSGGYTEDEILSLTPPSKPMGVKVGFTECINGIMYPELKWLHNLEPDMLSNHQPIFVSKKYKIYRAKSIDTLSVPADYYYIGTEYVQENFNPSFIDKDHALNCSTSEQILNIRYKIAAEDMYNDESVLSDFAGFSLTPAGLSVDNFNFKGNPFKYSLNQNYPNPFNPVTKINYSIATDGNVNLKIYNILGEEVYELVNDFRKKGDYQAQFDASNLPSGIYIYRIKTAFYSESKKMILLK